MKKKECSLYFVMRMLWADWSYHEWLHSAETTIKCLWIWNNGWRLENFPKGFCCNRSFFIFFLLKNKIWSNNFSFACHFFEWVGTLDGFSFDSEDEADKLPKAVPEQTDQNEDAEEPTKGKAKVKADKASVSYFMNFKFSIFLWGYKPYNDFKFFVYRLL